MDLMIQNHVDRTLVGLNMILHSLVDGFAASMCVLPAGEARGCELLTLTNSIVTLYVVCMGTITCNY
jgi:hypothetical protein